MVQASILEVLINQQWLIALKAATIQLHEITVLHPRDGFYFRCELLFSLVRCFRQLLHCHEPAISQLPLQKGSSFRQGNFQVLHCQASFSPDT